MSGSTNASVDEVPLNQRTLSRFSDYKGGYVFQPVRTNCNKCLGCVQMMNISEYYSHEVTPLLASSRHVLRRTQLYDRTLMFLLIMMLLIGATIGIYLLLVESEATVIEEFDFVSREKWGVNATFLKDVPPLRTPIPKVLLQELVPNCTDSSKPACLHYSEYNEDSKQKLKIFDGQVLYNFYEDDSGKIFEGRGSRFQSECGQPEGCTEFLTVGVIGQRKVPPSRVQTAKLKAFLDYAVADRVLDACYEVLVSSTSEKYFDDLAATIVAINRKNSACVYFY